MTGRRGVLKIVGGALATALGVALAIPAAAFLSYPVRRRRSDDGAVEVADLERLPDGKPVRVPVVVKRRLDAWTAFVDVTLGAAWLIRRGAEVQALSTVCPHAGCSVDWHPERDCFACPCHDSVFASDGNRTSGPAPRGMDPLAVEVKDGRVRVTYLRFRQGVSDREPV
jgi:Rieske Fe-S protein